MKNHTGCFRGFSHAAETWYGQFVLSELDRIDDVTIGFYAPGGGTTGEFTVKWKKIGGVITPQLCAFNDSWSALHGFADVLAAMAEHDDKHITPMEFCDLLRRFGIVDRTERIQQSHHRENENEDKNI